MIVRTRFAPSPTGDLHVGGAWTAFASATLTARSGGVSVLRVEDIDTPRVVPGSIARITEDLAWLGLGFDESPARGGPHAPYTQSARTSIYEAAIAKLDAAGLVYPCDCSRAEIARVASAPHPGEEIVYPGTCRDLDPAREPKRAPAIRLKVPTNRTIVFTDRVRGSIEQRIDTTVGDFVLRRGDGVFAYQLVVAVDDAAMEISDVVRADDLLASTPRQILIMELLGFATHPRYAHVPLVVAADGERLAKRGASITIRDLRARGVDAATIRRTLEEGLGSNEDPSAWRRDPWRIPAAWT